MIRSFATFARKPAIAGGCPIMNTAIEADDTHPELRDRARASMTLWHRLIGRIVKDGIADGELAPGHRPLRARRARSPARSRAALMLCGLYDDPAYVDRIVEHLSAYVDTLRARSGGNPMTAIEHPLRVTAYAAVPSRGPILRRLRFRGRGLTGYERLVAMQRGELPPPPAAALLGLEIERVEPGRTVFSMLADEVHENPMGTMHGGIVAALVDTAMGCAAVVDTRRRRGLHHPRAQDQLRARDHAGDRTACTRKAPSCTRAVGSPRPKHAFTTRTARCTPTPPRHA